jgi:hypothetical protein
MRRIFFILSLLLLTKPAFADNSTVLEQAENNVAEDDMYSGTQIMPLEKTLTAEEQQQENSTDVEFIEDTDTLPDLACNSENLKKQVENFIYQNINKDKTASVIEQRRRILLVNNLHNFSEIDITKDDGKNNFSAKAGATYLKINRKIAVSKVCRSSNNNSDKFADIYVIIYPQVNYYHIVVTNFITDVNDIDKSTFIYNW